MNSSTPDPAGLQALSRRHFGWHTEHFSRWWEYPWVARQLDPRPGQWILDAGAGKSPIPLYCAERGARVATVDNGSPHEAGEWGYFDYGTVGPLLSSRNENFTRLSWAEDGQFDAVTSVSVVEHLPAEARRRAFREFARTLKAGGRLVLTIDLEPDRFRLWNRCRGRVVEDPGVHGTLGSLVAELEACGFVLDTYETCALDGGETRVAGLTLTRSTLAAPVAGPESGAAPGRVLLGCVADDQPKYLAQAVRLAQSVRWFGGSLADADFLACIAGDPAPAFVEALRELGVTVRIVEPMNGVHAPSNKLRFYDQPEVAGYDRTLLLDCDTLVLGDVASHLAEPALRVKIADLPTVPMPVLERVFTHFGLALPPAEYRTTYLDAPTAWYCNSGVVAMPGEMAREFAPVWRRYNQELSDRLDLLAPHEFHCDQASLALAFAAHAVPYRELPVEMNFPTHLAEAAAPAGLPDVEPLVLHYHSDVDPDGYLLPHPYPGAQRRIEAFNARLRRERREHFDNRTFWDARYAVHPEHGSGPDSRGDLLHAKREFLAQVVGEIRPASILDLGCGDGEVAAGLAGPDGYTGVDLSTVAIARCRERWPEREYHAGDLRSLDRSAELVVCLDVLRYIPDPDEYRDCVAAIVERTERVGIVSGYDRPPSGEEDAAFFHEPLGESLLGCGVTEPRKLGEYRGTALWIFERAAVRNPGDHAGTGQVSAGV